MATDFDRQEHPGQSAVEFLSVAVLGPDESRLRALAAAFRPLSEVREFRSYPKAADELQWLMEQGYDVIAVDLDSDQDAALDLVQKISSAGVASVMVFSERADQKLAVHVMRAGAQEYLLLPLEEGVIPEALARAASTPRTKIVPAKKSAANLFVFLGAKGGCGVTTASCNLAVALARASEQAALLIDLNLPIGDAALTLGLVAERSTEDAFRCADRLDGTLLQKLLVKHSSGLMVLAAPSVISEAEPSREAVDRLIAVARERFDHVIIDLGSRIDAAARGILSSASTVYLVTQTGISELRNSNRLISRYFTTAVPKLEVVLNRFEPGLLKALDEDAVTKALGQPVRWKLPEDQEAAREMQNGETGNSDTRVSRVCLEMAGAITGRALPQPKKKVLGRRASTKSIEEGMPGSGPLPRVRTLPRNTVVTARRTPTLKWPTPAPIICGDLLTRDQLNASASVAGTFEYNPGLGEVLAPGTRTLSVVFIPADSMRYAVAEAQVSLEVLMATPTVKWPTPAPIVYGTALSDAQLCATASVPGTFNYSPALDEVLAAGKQTLRVTFTPADSESFTTARASVLLKVERAEPCLEWPLLQPIRMGTPLSAAHLCATASVPGSFEYLPAEGELLPAGAHTLTAVFKPADSANYASARISIPLAVQAREIPTITWPQPDPISYGTVLSTAQLCAAASVPGSFIYTPALDERLAAGKHVLSAAFTPADTLNYEATEVQVPLEVAKATPIVEWPTPQPIKDDTRLSAAQLCASASVPGSFEYSPAMGEILAPGTHTLIAQFTPADSANYTSTRAAVPIVVIARKVPEISWPDPEPIPYGTPLSAAQLCATASVPGSFDYSLAPGAVLAAGEHTIEATFTPTDAEDYASTRAAISLQVVQVKPSLEWANPVAVSYGTRLTSLQLCATAPVPGSFEYSPAAGDLLSAGSHTLRVTFTPADRVNYTPTEASVYIDVAKAVPVLDWPALDTIQCGTLLGEKQLSATASVSGTFTYSPAQGTELEAGSHVLSVIFSPQDGANYDTVQATQALEVVKIAPSITWPVLEPISYGTRLSTAQLCATASVPGRFEYSCQQGDLLSAGKHTLSVKFFPADSVRHSMAEAAVSLEILKAVPRIEWSAPAPVECGTALSGMQLCATASIPGMLTYSPHAGKVLAAGTHTLTVTFTPADSVNYAAAEAAVSLEVAKVTPSIEWSDPEPILYGTALHAAQLSATASVPGTFEYVPRPGELLGVGTHTLSVTFFPGDSANFATAQAAVSLQVLKATPVLEWPAPQPIPCDAHLGPAQLRAAAPVPGKFEYTPPAGSTLAPGRHTLAVTFIPKDSANYTTAEACIPLEVTRVWPLIDWPEPRAIICGTALGASQLNAAAWVPGTFTYSPSAGEVLPVGMHALSVTFTPAEPERYAEVRTTVLLQVKEKPKPEIFWSEPLPIPYGTALTLKQLCASASVPGTFTYVPAAGAMLSVGVHELSVTFAPANSSEYDHVQATVKLTVSKAAPTLTWSSPSPIEYGTPLDSSQLCATASVPGTFEYSPAPGQVLRVGRQVLSVTFTPADSVCYATAHASVTITVIKAAPILEWPAPKPIRFGVPLSSAQLCSTASIPGTFYYSHSSGDALPEGEHTLSVSFIPSDAEQYESAEASVVLEVRKRSYWGRIAAAFAACLILVVLLVTSFVFSNPATMTIQSVQPNPVVSAPQPNAAKVKPARKAKSAKSRPNKKATDASRKAPAPVSRQTASPFTQIAAFQSPSDSFAEGLDWISHALNGVIDSCLNFAEREAANLRM